jgi:hypothetical protein
MQGRPFVLIFVSFLLLAPAIAQVAQPYEINPAEWIFYMKEDYELKPIFFNFQIKNTQNASITVSLRTIPPQRLYEDQYPGIVAFPDYSWITIAEPEVTVPAMQTVEVPVHVVIPDQYYPEGATNSVSNYNKSYEAWFLADQTAGPGNIQVDYQCRWVFLTPPRYVPPWERPGALFPFPDYVIYLVAILIVVLVVCIVIIRRRSGRKKPSSGRKSRRSKKDDDTDDYFS